MILRVIIIAFFGIVFFVIGTSIGEWLWPGSSAFGALIAALMFVGFVLWLTNPRNQ